VKYEQAFLQDILAHPGDDAPRLIYADWLDEHDQPDRAEFIRTQIELARPQPPGRQRAVLESRERALLRQHRRAWTRHLPRWARQPTSAPKGRGPWPPHPAWGASSTST
jgi:uncharacterized protein (TIGR02996 family)